MVCGLVSVAIPSFTVPMFSNKRADSHIIQRERPFTRNAIAVAVATAPTPTWPFCHNTTPKIEVPNVKKILVA